MLHTDGQTNQHKDNMCLAEVKNVQLCRLVHINMTHFYLAGNIILVILHSSPLC